MNRSAATRCVLVARGVGDSSPRLAVKTSPPVVLFLFAFGSIRRLYSRVYRCPRNLSRVIRYSPRGVFITLIVVDMLRKVCT